MINYVRNIKTVAGITGIAIIITLAPGLESKSYAADLDKLKIAPKLDTSFDKDGLRILEDLPGYSPPVPLKRVPPSYPFKPQEKSQAGSVDVEFMVDAEGKVYDPIVTDSTNSLFEKSSLNAVSRYQYKPATLNGTPVDASDNIRIKYEMRGQKDAVSPKFARLHKTAQRYLNEKEPNKKEIRRKLDHMHKSEFLTHYSLAYLYILETIYAEKFLDKEEQLKAINKVLIFEDDVSTERKILDDEPLRVLRMNYLQLLIETGRYGEARTEYYYLKKELPSAAKPFKKIMSELYKRLRSDTPLSRRIDLTERGYELVFLTKRTFTFNEIDGEINNLKFRCDRAFGEIKFTLDSEFTVPESWGRCDLQIVGTQNTTAKLFQF